MIESERVLAAAAQRLQGDATLIALLPAGARGIHESVAPQGTATPFIVLDLPSAVDLNTTGGARVWQNTLVSATVRGKGLTSAIVPIADRVDQLLQGYQVTVNGAVIVKLRRERGFRLPPEVENGVRFPAIYQEYRTEAQAA